MFETKRNSERNTGLLRMFSNIDPRHFVEGLQDMKILANAFEENWHFRQESQIFSLSCFICTRLPCTCSTYLYVRVSILHALRVSSKFQYMPVHGPLEANAFTRQSP